MAQEVALKDDGVTEYREKILSKLSSVSAIPTASVELVRLVQEPDAPNAKLAQAIEYDPSLTREIPKKGLIKQRVKEGQYYRQMKKGCLVSFKVLEVRPQTVLADFNEPLAGISVSVDLKILSIRDASKAEIDAAHESQLKKSIGCG